MTGSSTGSWMPTGEDFTYVGSLNQPAVKALSESETGKWEVGGSLVLLGDGPHSTYSEWVRAQPDFATGTFEVRRPAIGAGKLIFTGVPPAQQESIRSAVGEFSDKEVEFG